jgi:TrmH family RNA methyltransferase
LLAQNRAQLPASLDFALATEAELSHLGTLATNNTALAVARIPAESVLADTLPTRALVLALDEVRDPGNLGTLLRLADWYGLPGVVLSDTCADPYSPKTVAATMGSFARVQVWQRDLPAWLAALPPAVGIFGADLARRQRAQPGSAARRRAGDGQRVARPHPGCRSLPHPPPAHPPRQGGGAESLNVAISAAILLDNFFRSVRA